jgi:4-amino-4-deoxychorismate lyase
LNPRLAGLHHINRLEQVLARGEWQDEVQEGLMQDTDGRVIEGTMSNLFLAVDGGLLTPDLSHSGVAGILRAQVLHQARTLGIPCRIETIDHDSVLRAEEIFLTNCIIGIWPVKKYEGKVYRIGKTTQALQAALTQCHCYEPKD